MENYNQTTKNDKVIMFENFKKLCERNNIDFCIDKSNNIVCHKKGNGKKICISFLSTYNEIIITKLKDKTAMFEIVGDMDNEALKDKEVFLGDKSVGIIRVKSGEDKKSELFIELWDSEDVKIGDICTLDCWTNCKGDLLYGSNINGNIAYEIADYLLGGISKSVNDICFTVSFSETSLDYLIPALMPDDLYTVYCVKSEKDIKVSSGTGIVFKDGNGIIDKDIRNDLKNMVDTCDIPNQVYIGKSNFLLEKIGLISPEIKVGALCIPIKYKGSGCELADMNDIKNTAILLSKIITV